MADVLEDFKKAVRNKKNSNGKIRVMFNELINKNLEVLEDSLQLLKKYRAGLSKKIIHDIQEVNYDLKHFSI